MKTIVVTGVAGFIGWKTAEVLLKGGYRVVGIDNLNDYYDVRLKRWRLDSLKKYDNFFFHYMDIEELSPILRLFDENMPIEGVINLAARAGVRYSIENPFVYVRTNSLGHLNILEACRRYGVRKVVLASTSSLYAGQKTPFKEELAVNEPISPYAASKKSAEVMSYTYFYLYGISTAVLRYFTVYGPAGRPDMSIFRFIKWIDEGKKVKVFGDGRQSRDFTYIEDIAEGTVKALSLRGYNIINLGNNSPRILIDVIKMIESALRKKADIEYLDFHKADLRDTWADIQRAGKLLNWKPKTPIEEGIGQTVEWYKRNREWLKNIQLGVA